jgi:hypothetical protein
MRGGIEPSPGGAATVVAALVLASAAYTANGCGGDSPTPSGDVDGPSPAPTPAPVIPSNWGEPEELPYPVNAGAGWTDMPAIDPTGSGLWFVYWNGDHFDDSLDCPTIGPAWNGYHGELFDLHFALSTPSDPGFAEPAVFDPEPRQRYSAPADQACLLEALECACLVWGPSEAQPGCDDPTRPCSAYEGCRAPGSEAAAVRSLDGESLYFSREELELDAAGRLAPNTRIWVGHPMRDSGGAIVGWGDPVRLPETINARGIRVDTPAVSPDNRRLCVSRADAEAFNAEGDSAFELWCADRSDPTDDQAWGPLWRSALNGSNTLDYQPMFTSGGELLFTTTRGTDVDAGVFRLTVHRAQPSGGDYVDGGIFPALSWYDDPPNNHREGAGSLSADARTFYFIRGTGTSTDRQDLCRFELRIFRSRALD